MKKIFQYCKPSLLLLVIILLAACGSSTKLTKTWTDPSVSSSGFKDFKKVLVIARLKDETGNRIAEDKIAASFRNGKAVASYTYLQPGDTARGVVDERLKKDGFDGLVYMELKDVNKSISVQDNSYGGYYGYRYGGGYTTVSENQTYLVETSFYSLANGKMLWSGTTSTFNPGNLERMLDEIIKAIRQQLTKQGLIKAE